MKKIICFWILFFLTIVSAEAAKVRSFYITRETFTGAQALAACADGYHMASLWEIFDVSNFKYDTKRGLTLDDSGSGPPIQIGWIRTGFSSGGTTGIPGFDNCFAWSSDSSDYKGSAVALNFWWNTPPLTPVDPWISYVFYCNQLYAVWCVQD